MLFRSDFAVSMAVVRPENTLLTVTENGFGKVTNVDEYRLTKRGGKGVITIRTTERNGPVVSVRKVAEGEELIVNSVEGKVLRISVDSIRKTSRNTQGVKIMDLRDGDKITAVESVVEDDDIMDVVEKTPERKYEQPAEREEIPDDDEDAPEQ